jgi:DNA topoisomerase-3
VADPGWTVLYPRKVDDKKEEDQDLPEFRPGETGPHDPFVRRGEMTPPKPYTEGSLLGAMETAGRLVAEEPLKEALKERGLGTPATRASIIETLLSRDYITRDKKSLVATDLGRYLVAIVRNRSLKSPELTGDWEAKLRQVEHGRLGPREFMAEIVRYTADVIGSDRAAAVDHGRLGDCPRCGRPVIVGKRGYGCSGWRDGCSFVLWREHRDQPLTEDQVRELLQLRVLGPLTIDGSVQVLLHLTDNGGLTDIPVPIGNGWRKANTGRTGRTVAGQSSGLGPRTGTRPRKGTRPRQHSGAEVSAPASDDSTKISPKTRKNDDGHAIVALGPCPLCGSAVVEQPKSYSCTGRPDGCRFVVWKTIAGKMIGIRAVQSLLKNGHSLMIKGFRSKAGRPFEARLKLEGGEVRFDFS